MLVDVPEEHLTAGDMGTIVIVFRIPNLAYEVEFCDECGRTRAQLPLLPHQVELEARIRTQRGF